MWAHFIKSFFALDPEAFEKAWQPGCKILCLISPPTQTGGTVDKAKLERLAKFAVEKDLIVISDEIYAELTYEGDHVSIVSLPYAGEDHSVAWIFQRLCHDWFQSRFCLRS